MKKLMFVLLGLANMNAYSNDVTQGALQNNPALCSYGYNSNCGGGGGGYYTPPVRVEHIVIQVPPKYGALSYNTKKNYLTGALEQNSLAEAKSKALKACREKSGDNNCIIFRWTRNGCLAAAPGKMGNKYSLVSGAGKVGEAEPEALNGCSAHGAKDCKIVLTERCSLPPELEY